MPISDFKCKECSFEFEDFFNHYNPIPTECPECKKSDCVEKLITLPKTKGKVELTGQELNAQMKQDISGLKKRVKRDEKFLANIVGETKYNQNNK